MLEYADLSRTIIGLGLVLLLMVAVFWLIRRFGPAEARGRFAANRRLAVLEALPLDPRTRLVLLRHDQTEHLVLVSSQGSASLLTSTGSLASTAGQPATDRDDQP